MICWRSQSERSLSLLPQVTLLTTVEDASTAWKLRILMWFACREQRGVTTDLGSDPTLVCYALWYPYTANSYFFMQAHSDIRCPQCGHEEYVQNFVDSTSSSSLLYSVLYSIKINQSGKKRGWSSSLSVPSVIIALWTRRYLQRVG